MSVIFAIFGVVIGLLLYRLIITPIQIKKAREECIRDGLVPRDMT
jgi:hypothetical protein